MALSTIILEAGGVFGIAVSQDASGNVGVNVQNFPATQTVSGTVAVSSVGGTVAVTGTFWQATQPVSGTVAVTQSTSPWIVDASGTTVPVNVQNSSLPVTGTFWQTTQPVSGSVSVSNFPSTQNTQDTADGTVGQTAPTTATQIAGVDGTGKLRVAATDAFGNVGVNVMNTPAVTFSGTPTVDAAQSGAWSVSVSNFPVTQPVSGTVAVSNFPATQAVSGTVRCLGNAGGAFDSATATTVPANAILSGNRGTTANPAAVTDGQNVASMADKLGRQVVVSNQVRDLVICTPTTIASTSGATEIMAAGGANVYRDIVSLIITQNTATAATATLSDGTQSFIFDLAATVGTGLSIQFPTPLKASSPARNWTIALSSSAITVHITCVAVNNL